MRIIAGELKGRALKVPTSVTRPTSSRVREALFSSITHQVGDCSELNVLDLFAGSGALGFEALSRGAHRATFIESDRKACDCIQSNAEHLNVQTATIIQADAVHTVATKGSAQFDLVFIDPPYALSDDEVREVLEQLAVNMWLAIDAMVIVERSGKSKVDWPNFFTPLNNKTYGDTSIWYGQYSPDRVDANKE
jgi:16S rRNA (guanine966-N2)-methyltransferase